MSIKFLTQSYPTEKSLFLIPKFVLRIVGFYPEQEKSTIRRNAWTMFNLIMLIYGSYAEFMYGVHYLSIDAVRALDALCPVASSIMSVLKLSLLWWHRVELERLIRRVSVLTAEQDSRLKNNYNRRYFTIATRFSAALLCLGTCTSTLYTIRAALANYFSYVRGENVPYETPFKMIFPQTLLSKWIFPVTFTFSHWHGYITVAGFTGTDGLFLCFCMYFGTLLKALQIDLKDLLKDMDCGQHEGLSERDIEECMKKIVMRHNEIIDLIGDFSAVMSSITLTQFVLSSVIIGTSVVDMLLFSDYGILLYFVHALAVTTELFLYGIGGTTVIECSSQLATAVYDSNWYSHNVEVKKMVLFMILRTQRSLVIKVPFFAPSLPALTSILRFTGSLIALVKSVV